MFSWGIACKSFHAQFKNEILNKISAKLFLHVLVEQFWITE